MGDIAYFSGRILPDRFKQDLLDLRDFQTTQAFWRGRGGRRR